MKIICIFADHLFAFHFKDETYNELRRLLILWNDTSYLHHFVMQKIDICRDFLKSNCVFDADSFYEFLKEQ